MSPRAAPRARAAAAALAALAALGSAAEAPGCAGRVLDRDTEAEPNHIGLLQTRSTGVRGGHARGVTDSQIKVHFLRADRDGDGALSEAEASRFLNSLEDARMDELARTFRPPRHNESEREARRRAWEAEREKEKEAHEAEMEERREAHEAEMAKRDSDRRAHEEAMRARRKKEQEAREEEREAREEARRAHEAEVEANRSKLEKAREDTWDRCHGAFLIALDCTMIPEWEGGSRCICEPGTCGRWFGWCMNEDTRPLYNYTVRQEHLANLSRAYGSLTDVLPDASELASTLQVGAARSRFGHLFARADANGDQLISHREAANLVRLASASAQDRAAVRKVGHGRPYDRPYAYDEDEDEETVEERNANNNARCKAAFQAAIDCTMVPPFAGGARCDCMGDACHDWLGRCMNLPKGTPPPELRANVEQAYRTAAAVTSESIQEVASAMYPRSWPAEPTVAPKAPESSKVEVATAPSKPKAMKVEVHAPKAAMDDVEAKDASSKDASSE